MARPIKFALEMKDGVKVRRTLEEIRQHFDMAKATEHFASGQLVKWLDDRGYEDEAERLRSLDSHAEDFPQQFCDALGVPYVGGNSVDMEAVARLNDRRNLLRQKTSDEEIIAHAAETAFTQEELTELLATDTVVIYLCGDEFAIPDDVREKKFVGVEKKPKVTLEANSREELAEKKLVFENVELPEKLNEPPKPKFDAREMEHAKETAKIGSIVKVKPLLEKYAMNGEGWAAYFLALTATLVWDSQLLMTTREKYLQMGMDAGDISCKNWYARLGKCKFAQGDYNKLYEAARNGDYIAQTELYNRLTEKKDYSNGMEWLKKAANAGYAVAQYELAECYQFGHNGLPENSQMSKHWYNKSAINGYFDSQWRMGESCKYSGELERAVCWYESAAKQGYWRGARELGECYEKGIGVRQDLQVALRYYRKLADSGDMGALSNIGDMYYEGKGVSQNYTKAFECYMRVADKGNDFVYEKIGDMYYYGLGVRKDVTQAKDWYEKASQQGYPTASKKLARMTR